jgi:hypothetical protein
MTNCDFTRQAVKTEKDLIICKKKFQSITKDEWLKMCNIQSHKIESNIIIPTKTEEEIRKIRANYFKKII